MENFDKEKFERVQKKVKDIKGFYTHLVVYLVVNIFIILIQLRAFNFEMGNFDITVYGYLSTPFFWGIGLLFHGLYVFQHKFKFFRDWEERKIKEFMEKEDEEFKNTSNWE